MKITRNLHEVVLAPTSLCNMACKYCYLLTTKLNHKMSAEVARRSAAGIEEYYAVNPDAERITVLWHAGEPLSCGIKHFKMLLEPFEGLYEAEHIGFSVQTNATLINQEWCQLFKDYDFAVGVSVDGSEEMNAARVDWNGKPMFPQIMRGIEILKKADIPIHALAVVNELALGKPEEFYQFFVDVDCSRLAINIEEIELANESIAFNAEQVREFWKGLYAVWSENPVVRIREFDQILLWLSRIDKDPNEYEVSTVNTEPLPTILWDGDVIWGSPELAGAHIEPYGDFVFGNILEEGFVSLLDKFHNIRYIREYEQGKKMCSEECNYFSYCRGGDLSNKIFENGTPLSTVTQHCTNKFILPVDVVLDGVIATG